MIKSVSLDTRPATSKGQKIIAALFLVTGHLPENDPFRLSVRSSALLLLDVSGSEREHVAAHLQTLLGAAVIAKLINEKNASILHTELASFAALLREQSGTLEALFPEDDHSKGHFLSKKTFTSEMSFTSNKGQTSSMFHGVKKDIDTNGNGKENKSIRHEKILSFINTRKSANIKDISALFPDISEKTIQRELGHLVASGKITKRGDKRWSLYLAVSA